MASTPKIGVLHDLNCFSPIADIQLLIDELTVEDEEEYAGDIAWLKEILAEAKEVRAEMAQRQHRPAVA